jgi:hypothetical protein
MLTTISLLALGATGVPTAGAAYLQQSSPFYTTWLLVAQADDAFEDPSFDDPNHPDAEEEDRLEQDMKRARRHTRGEPRAVKPAPLPEAPEADEPAPAAATTEAYDAGDDSYENEEPAYEEQDRAPRRRRAEARPPQLLYDGEGWVHYLVWGIVDWCISGGMLVGGVVMAGYAVALYAAWNSTTWNRGSGDDIAAISFAVVSAGLGVGGAIVAWRAGVNIGVMRDLKNGVVPD